MREINSLIDQWDFRHEESLRKAGQPCPPLPDRVYFDCPGCGHTNEQQIPGRTPSDAENGVSFHYWCEQCGKNAMDIVQERDEREYQERLARERAAIAAARNQ